MSKKGTGSRAGGIVKFHDAHDPQFGVLSPLSPHPLVVRYTQYPSLHHYFLCERFAGTPVAAQIQRVASVWELERLVQEAEANHLQRPDWNRTKIDVMLLGCYSKFRQNEGPRRTLLETDSAMLVDHTPLDDFWGDGGDGSGKNIMGVILMAVRERLLTEAAQEQQRRTTKAGSAAGTGVRAVRAAAGRKP